jgi:hypothetical protein
MRFLHIRYAQKDIEKQGRSHYIMCMRKKSLWKRFIRFVIGPVGYRKYRLHDTFMRRAHIRYAI